MKGVKGTRRTEMTNLHTSKEISKRRGLAEKIPTPSEKVRDVEIVSMSSISPLDLLTFRL
jgi:hypothetical protein